MVAYVPLIGLEIGTTSIVGKYIGARDFASANRSIFSGIKIGVIYSGTIISLFVGIPDILANVFAPQSPGPEWEESYNLAVSMIRLAAVYVSVAIFIVIYAGALRGAGDTLAVMFITSGQHWILVAIVWLFFNVLKMEVIATWSITVFTYTVFPLFLYLRWKGGKWRKMWEKSAEF
jgi:MATE family multidrug resistance protein